MRELVAVILAGGYGERLWPLSRKKFPKQFLPLFDNKSLFMLTIERVSKLTDKILVVTEYAQKHLIKKQLKNKAIVLYEPQRRNTSAAIALAASYLSSRFPNSMMAVFPADHFIRNINAFLHDIKLGYNFLEKNDLLLTFGIRPNYPAVSYGYIKVNSRIKGWRKIYKVDKFIEKPSLKRAYLFFKNNNFYWNSGIFMWRTGRILKEYEKYMPHDYTILQKIIKAMRKSISPIPASLYQQLSPLSIDYAIMEKTPNIVLIKAGFKWDDLGSYCALAHYLPQDRCKNAIFSSVETIISDSQHNVFINLDARNIIAQGVHDIIVVNCKDLVFITDKSKSLNIKYFLQNLSKKGWEKLL